MCVAARCIRLDCREPDAPVGSQILEQRLWSGRPGAEGFEEAAPNIIEHAHRPGNVCASKLGRKETTLGRSSSMEPLGHCPVVNKRPQPARETRCRADCGGG